MIALVIIISFAIIISVLVLAFRSQNPNKHMGGELKMFVKKMGLIILGCLVLWFLSLYGVSKYETSKGAEEAKAEGFTIESYDVLLDVKESCVIDVKEIIKVDFFETGHHGIYRFIPEWLEYTDKDGKTESRRSVVSNMGASESSYVSGSKDKKRIRIGDSKKTLPIGIHDYMIAYTYDMGSDPHSGFDELIFHAIGDYWGTKINNPSITVKLPKKVDLEGKIKVFTDKYRKNDITDKSEIKITDDGVVVKPGKDVALNSALTIDILLPDNYFVGGTNPYGNISLILCIICIAFAVASFLMWAFVGKDRKAIAGVEFYPPNGMDPAEVGYVYGVDDHRKLTIALIIQLAAKKAIKIYDDFSIKRLIEKGEASSFLNKNEQTVFDGMFDGREDQNIRLKDVSNILTIIFSIEKNLQEKFDGLIKDKKSNIAMTISGIMFVVGTALWPIAYYIVEDLSPSLSFLYYIAFAALPIIVIFTIIMGRSTSEGKKLSAQIESFKNYIEVARKDQLEMLVEENPSYFYDILPYAYVFNLSNKWANKFDNIEFDKVDFGTLSYDMFDSISVNLYEPPHTSTNTGSGGSSCSSCGGGGCSSCGGGGSW